MKSLVRLTDYTKKDIYDIFNIADEVSGDKYKDILRGKTVILFFPTSSIRTRVTFEKGIHLLGGQSILFPMDTLDKKEELKDVCGYLNNWADMIIVRHKDINVIQEIERHSSVPVINAMTDINHPCEVITDMYALSKIRQNFISDKYLFCGENGNIGLAWKEASEVMGFDLSQCCAENYEIDDLKIFYNIKEAIKGKDIICTDSLSPEALKDFIDCRITKVTMENANEGALLNPCPPFYRDEIVSSSVIDSKYFVGYEFKKYLLDIHQAIMIYCLMY